MSSIREIINQAGLFLDLAGVSAIVLGVCWASLSYLFMRKEDLDSLRSFRKSVGRSILLGLEFLVGGDIIRTVSVEHPVLDDVLVLGLIVVIRIALSWAMEIELEGALPWRGRQINEDQR